MDVSICIPTKNGGEQLRQVLEAVFHQQTELEYEVICIDSGSTDGTLEIIGAWPRIRLHQISAEEFGHGRTRNLAAKLGRGEFIVFLTQDAVPATSGWLDQMIRAMRMEDRIALCFGAHYPYPDCNLLDRRDILNHFRSFGLENTVYRLEDRERYARDEGYRQMLAFSSDNNACVRREIFEKHPYPDVEFAEDQIWTRQMMEMGYSKVYCPYAPVYHSHNYSPREYARRYYDEYKGIQEIQGKILVPDAKAALREAKSLIRHDVNYVRTQPLSYRQKFDWCRYVVRRDAGRYRAAYHAGKYPKASPAQRQRMDRKYSQQYGQRHRGKRLSAQPVVWDYRDLWNYSGEMAAEVTEAEKKIHVEQRFGAVMETAEIPFSQEEYEQAKDGPMIVNWVIPEPVKGSGGHTTIFRFISAMEGKGLHNRIYLLEPKFMRRDEEARDFLLENFPLLSAEVEIFAGCGRMRFGHATIATSWLTAYFVRRFKNTISRFYFVQDFEPSFYPMGSEYILAENTYRFGFRGITAGDWLKEKLEREYQMPCDSFHFSYDKMVYRPGKKRDSRKRVFFYARPVTARRGFEVGLLALTRLAERCPDLEVVFAGGDISGYHIPFPHRSEGVLRPEELAEWYTQSDICLVMSLTNLSLLPLEIMACGGVVATQEGENNTWMLHGESVIITGSDPVQIADTLADYLDQPERLQALRENGLRFAQGTDWARETEKVYQSVVKGVREDESQREQPRPE